MTQPTPKASPTPKATPKAKPQIQIQIQILPIQPQDLPALALLESHVFLHDPFSITAFGLEKDGAENLAVRVKGLEKTLAGRNGKRTVHMKAIVEGEIVGWSSWSFVHVGEEGEEDEKMEVEVEKEKEKGDKVIGDGQMGEGEGEVDDHDGWGITANVKFCRDVFLVADGWMVDVTKGEDYAKLNALIIHPLYQRQGIGTLMLSEGLKEVDELKLQCVLGASPEGKGLYERFAFEEVGRMELNLEEYENGEGMGGTVHGVMWRDARG